MLRLRIVLVALVVLALTAAATPRHRSPQQVAVQPASTRSNKIVKLELEREVVDPTTTTTAPPPPPTTTAPPPPPPPPPRRKQQQQPAAQKAPQPVPAGDAAAAVHQWFPDNFESAWGVSGCESGHDPGAVSPGGGNWGLFQINTSHRADFAAVTGVSWDQGVLNANYNAQYARHLYDSSGWGPWSCKWAA